MLKITVVKIGAALGPTLIPLLKGLAEGIADITKKIENLGGGLTILGAQIKLTLVEMLLAVFEQIADILNQLPGSLGVMFGAWLRVTHDPHTSTKRPNSNTAGRRIDQAKKKNPAR